MSSYHGAMSILSLPTARTLTHEEHAPRPDLPEGVLVEISGAGATARLSSAVAAVRAAQREGETTVWIERAGSEGADSVGTVFPPDLWDSGIEMAALPIVRIPPDAGEVGPFRAAEMLLRSGAFGFVVIDLRDSRSSGRVARIPMAWQGRLLGGAREHQARILFLTTKRKSKDSVGSLVGLRFQPQRRRVRPGLFIVDNQVLKNKAGLSLLVEAERRRGPWGLS